MVADLPFKLVEPGGGTECRRQGDLLLGRSSQAQILPLKDGNVQLLDFRPDVSIERGAYEDDYRLDDLADLKPTNRPYRGNYKTRAFEDVIRGAKAGDVIVDLGCSNCELLAAFPGNAVRVGVDISSRSMLGMTPNALDSGVQHLWLCDATALPAPDDMADVVLCCDLLEHLLEPEKLLREARRVLKPGGLLVVTVPNLVSLPNRLSILLGCGAGIEFAQALKGKTPFVPITGPRFPDQRHHLRWFTSASLVRFLASEGFQTRRRFGCGPIVTRLRLNRLAHAVAMVTGAVACKA